MSRDQEGRVRYNLRDRQALRAPVSLDDEGRDKRKRGRVGAEGETEEAQSSLAAQDVLRGFRADHIATRQEGLRENGMTDER